jgi:uncharacterized damage-inducible protein DinB
MTPRVLITAVQAEYARYKAYADGAMAQLTDEQLNAAPTPNASNSIVVICWHVSGNLASRFTDLLTSDGEKPWRARDEEFERRHVTRAELTEKWERGWQVLMATCDALSDADLARTVTIRQQPLTVNEALLRSLAHVSYHVGQIVYAAKVARDGDWQYLSIPPGGSAAYNNDPKYEKPSAHAAGLKG